MSQKTTYTVDQLKQAVGRAYSLAYCDSKGGKPRAKQLKATIGRKKKEKRDG